MKAGNTDNIYSEELQTDKNNLNRENEVLARKKKRGNAEKL